MKLPKRFDNIGKNKNVVYVSDETTLKIIDDLLNNASSDENVMKAALIIQMKLLMDIRIFLRKLYKNMSKKSKVFDSPTNNEKDIIVGEK